MIDPYNFVPDYLVLRTNDERMIRTASEIARQRLYVKLWGRIWGVFSVQVNQEKHPPGEITLSRVRVSADEIERTSQEDGNDRR